MTTTTHIAALDRSVDKANIWLRDTAAELGVDDRHAAYAALRSVLHALRDRLPVDEAAQLAAQLPLLIRGVYYEGWNPSATPASYSRADDLYERVVAGGGCHGATEASFAVAAVMRVLRVHVSAGELDDVLGALPAGVRAAFEQSPA